MFGMKKKTIQMNAYDNRYHDLWVSTLEAQSRVEEDAVNSYLKSICVSVYPDGADKNKVTADAEHAKQMLLVSIGAADGKLRDLREYYHKHFDELEMTKSWNAENFEDSHECIENAIKSFLKKG